MTSRIADFLPGLALALAIGLLIGIERGWRLRDERPGARVAGIRTFALLGLFGGLIGIEIAGPLRFILLALGVLAAGAILVGYHAEMQRDGSVSATSALAAVFTLGLGVIAGSGNLAAASVGGGAAVILLASRGPLHKALVDTSEEDIRALIRLVLVAFVILPLLPDTPLGPFELNLRRLWMVVVIVGSISFLGYVLIRLLGPRRGVLVTAILGSLVSSTAVTLECARRMRAGESVSTNLAAIAIASSIMFVRSGLLVGLLAPQVLPLFLRVLLPALGISFVAVALMGYRAWSKRSERANGVDVRPPDLKLAFLFGGLVLAMTTLAAWAESRIAGGGAAVIALGGIVDVDSAIASIGTLPLGTLPPRLSALAIAVPVIFNTFLKIGMTVTIAGFVRALPVVAALGVPALVMVLLTVAVAG